MICCVYQLIIAIDFYEIIRMYKRIVVDVSIYFEVLSKLKKGLWSIVETLIRNS